MQTRRTNPDHHHQTGVFNERHLCSSPEAELIALARIKGQTLTAHTLRGISETLELLGVPVEEFVADVRPHFRNNILNPSGFLLDRARRFHQLSRPAVASAPSTPVQSAAIKSCEACGGQKYVMNGTQIGLCQECSTAEDRRKWELKEAERARKVRAVRSTE